MRRHIITMPATLDVVEIVDFLNDRDVEAGEDFIQKVGLPQHPPVAKAQG